MKLKTQNLTGIIESAQVRAMIFSRQRGEILAKQYPEIAERWIGGETERDLGTEYLPNDTIDVRRNAIHYALKELLDDDERIKYAREHLEQGGKRGGKITGIKAFKNKTKIWAPENNEKLEAGRIKGGKISGKMMGKTNYDLGLGLAALTQEQRIETGKKTAYSRGQIPYEDIEKETDMGLVNEKDYIISLKSFSNLTWVEIAQQVNCVFRNNRNSGTINMMYNRRWKRG